MLQLTNVSKSYAAQPVLEDISFIVNPGEHVGLIGPNGSGKTTLLRIILGQERPDGGRALVDAHATVGYLAQGIAPDSARTVGEHLRAGIAGFEEARRQVELLAGQMADQPTEDALAAYGEAIAAFEVVGGYAVEHRLESILAGLGLAAPMETPLTELSGGLRARVGLARALVAEPNLLLLDEPTNHLDIAALEWLERFVVSYPGAAIIISHDWTFLDATVSRILELDDKTHRVTEYAGNYSAYVDAKTRGREQQFEAWQDQQTEVKRLQNSARHLRGIAKFRKGGKADSGDKFAKGFFANRGLGTVRRAKQIERRVEHLMTDEHIEKPSSSWQMKLEFGAMPHGGQIVVALEDLGFAFDRSTLRRFGEPSQGSWLFRHAELTLRHGERIALVGPNGSGKTTLLRIITRELLPTEGSVHIGANVRIGYMPQEQETLDADATPLSIIRDLAAMGETKARHFLHFFLFEADEVFTRVGALSYGERARLLLARLIVSGVNCLLLDEPINHLDIPSRAQFTAALDAFPGTTLIATHDRAFIDQFANGIWSPRDGTLRRYVDREAMGRGS